MIRTTSAHLHTAAVTHPGTAGKENEDRLAVSSFRLSQRDSTRSVLAIVSDGIGGHRAGEVAAEMAVETISQMVAESEPTQPLDVLDRAIQAASQAIATRAKDDTQRLGMGTTCACAWVIGSRLFTATVGDSRIYLLRNGELMRLTTDHTWVQEAMEKGILDPRQVRNHPYVHVIRRYLGSSKTPEADTRMRLATDESDTQARSNQGLRLLPGDMLMLCTDGLTDVVEDDEIEPAVRGLGLQQAAQALVNLAVGRGAKDNITVVLLLVPWQNPPTRPRLQPTRGKRKMQWWVLWGLMLVLLALVVLVMGWVIFRYILPPFQ
jgi:serine/threonine protein phosphatase PrpC